MKVFISGGGTGGHFYPAFSVAEYLKDKCFKVYYIGTTNGIENKKSFPADEEYLYPMKAVRGKGLIGKMLGIFSLIKTTLRVLKILRKEKPDISICFGGYTSIPLGIASFLTKTPLFIHEQNSIPSYSNRILSLFSRKIFITFKNSKNYFKESKTILTGLPLRKILVEKAKSYTYIPNERKTILVLGGSQGSKKLSQITINIASKIDTDIILIKGKWDIDIPNIKNLTVYDYVDNIEELYIKSDIVISRAGSSSVNEILCFGKYTIFIPYPYAASNHQYYNVKWLYEKGLCDLIEEKELDEEKLKKSIEEAFKKDLALLNKEIKKYAIFDSDKKIVENILDEIKTYRT